MFTHIRKKTSKFKKKKISKLSGDVYCHVLRCFQVLLRHKNTFEDSDFVMKNMWKIGDFYLKNQKKKMMKKKFFFIKKFFFLKLSGDVCSHIMTHFRMLLVYGNDFQAVSTWSNTCEGLFIDYLKNQTFWWNDFLKAFFLKTFRGCLKFRPEN